MTATDPLVDSIVLGLPDVATVDGPALNLPADFWAARPRLAHVHQAAHSRASSPDALLAFVLARVAAATPPSVRLPAIVGAAGSLNFCAAVIGPPGAGKSTSKRAAAELITLDDDCILDDVPIGSGEGLVDAFFEMATIDEDGKKVKRKTQTKTAVVAYIDEGQALAEMGKRSGATLLPTLRSAWTGDTLGQHNASDERRRRLGAHSYRLSVVVGFQPEHAVGLLDDAAGGTPQRFLWLAASDPAVPYDPPTWPGPLRWTPAPPRRYGAVDFPTTLDVPDTVAAEVRRANVARTRGEEAVDPLDVHHDLGRLKVAGLLALLDDRDAIDLEDWDLAGQVMATSGAVRASVIDRAHHAARIRELANNDRELRRVTHVEGGRAAGAALRMAEAIARHVHRQACEGGCRIRCASRATRSTDRQVAPVEEALSRAEAEGWIARDGTTVEPGRTRPA